MNNTGWNKRVTEFFTKYVGVRKDGYDRNGNLTPTTIKAAVKFLLERKAFSSVEDMRLQAAKDHSVILPHRIFE